MFKGYYLFEVPLAHFVRGGMVRTVGEGRGKKVGGGNRRPPFSHFDAMRNAPFRQRR